MFDRFDVREVVMDPDRAVEIAAWIDTELGVEATEHGQGVEMYEAYDAFMEAIRNGWLRHPGDPTFTEHVLNATAGSCRTAGPGSTGRSSPGRIRRRSAGASLMRWWRRRW
jgi:hypothetical protein